MTTIRPTIIRSEGAESFQLLLGGVCADIINPSLDRTESRQLASFMRCTGAHPALDLLPLVNKAALDLTFEELGPRDFLEWCGVIVVAQVGQDEESDWAIVIPNVSQSRRLPSILIISITLGQSNMTLLSRSKNRELSWLCAGYKWLPRKSRRRRWRVGVVQAGKDIEIGYLAYEEPFCSASKQKS